MKVYGNHQFMPKGTQATQTPFVAMSKEELKKQQEQERRKQEALREKPVVKVSIKDGSILAHFKSAQTASDKTGIARTTISNGCNNKTLCAVNSYCFRFLDEYTPDEEFNSKKNHVPIPLIGTNGIKKLWFRKMRDVSDFVGLKNITTVKNHLDRNGSYEHDGWLFTKCQRFSDGLGVERWSNE